MFIYHIPPKEYILPASYDKSEKIEFHSVKNQSVRLTNNPLVVLKNVKLLVEKSLSGVESDVPLNFLSYKIVSACYQIYQHPQQ